MNDPLRQRAPRVEDPAHLEFVRSKPCCVCGRPPRSEAAHIRMASYSRGKRYTGQREKPDDRWTTPLCPVEPGRRVGCHYRQSDRRSESDFWEQTGLDPFVIAERLWVESGAAERHRFDAPGPAPKKCKRAKRPRPRPHKRVKRSWPKRDFPQGRGFNR